MDKKENPLTKALNDIDKLKIGRLYEAVDPPDRLLSEEEMQDIFSRVYGKEEAEIEAIHTFIHAIAKAQDAKTLQVVLKWLGEQCKEHYGITHVRHNHIDCPQCMAELRGEQPFDPIDRCGDLG